MPMIANSRLRETVDTMNNITNTYANRQFSLYDCNHQSNDTNSHTNLNHKGNQSGNRIKRSDSYCNGYSKRQSHQVSHSLVNSKAQSIQVKQITVIPHNAIEKALAIVKGHNYHQEQSNNQNYISLEDQNLAQSESTAATHMHTEPNIQSNGFSTPGLSALNTLNNMLEESNQSSEFLARIEELQEEKKSLIALCQQLQKELVIQKKLRNYWQQPTAQESDLAALKLKINHYKQNKNHTNNLPYQPKCITQQTAVGTIVKNGPK